MLVEFLGRFVECNIVLFGCKNFPLLVECLLFTKQGNMLLVYN